MGTSACCSDDTARQKQEFGQVESQTLDPPPLSSYDTTEVEVKIPKLSAAVEHKRHLLSNQSTIIDPFGSKILEAKNVKTKQYGGDIYHGDFYQGSVYPQGYGEMYKADGSYFAGEFTRGRAQGPGFYITNDGGLVFSGTMHGNHLEKGTLEGDHFKYTGEFKDNKFDGRGVEELKDTHQRFEGIYQKGNKKEGEMSWGIGTDSCKYKGAFNDHGQFHGKGILSEPKGTYDGSFVNGHKSGKGVYTYKDGVKYDGEYLNGLKSGTGKLYKADGSVSYEGTFLLGLPHGKGKAFEDGTWVQGEWDSGVCKNASITI